MIITFVPYFIKWSIIEPQIQIFPGKERSSSGKERSSSGKERSSSGKERSSSGKYHTPDRCWIYMMHIVREL